MAEMRNDRLSAAEAGMVRRGRPIPLVGLFTSIAGWIEQRHLELMGAAGFEDVRRAHNAVFVHLPAGGIRLTDLARAAGISKQAMAELVNELVEKKYLRRIPDPSDGRAKLIVAAARGDAAHIATLEIFNRIEAELADVVGSGPLERVRGILTQVLEGTVLHEQPPGTPRTRKPRH